MPSLTDIVKMRVKRIEDLVPGELKTKLDKPANKLAIMHRQVVIRWSHKVIFAYRITVNGDTVAVSVFAKGANKLLYLWVDKGTAPHIIQPRRARVLSFQTGHRAKTAPVARYNVGSGKATGKLVFARVVHHPGTEAREFSSTFAKRMKPEFKQAIHEAIRSAISRSKG